MKFKKWNIGTPDPQAAERLREAGYPYLLSTVLAARGVDGAESAAEFLDRERKLTLSPMLMQDMDKAVGRIQQAIAEGETVAVFGDYDVDGITSTVLLMDYLKNCGVRCLRYIPRRIEDGYGLSKDAIQGLRDQGATLMVTVDCGITGNDEVDFANSIGLDVVVTDHHECKETLPRAVAVVDPHRPDCPYPFKHLAGVGVALKLVLALGGESREDALFARYCTLAAIGTIADVMRMEGENRTIVSCGLEALPHTDFVGVHALLKEAGDAERINFTGNIEADEAMLGGADVIVADGYTGNIMLKSVEGVGKFLLKELKKMFLSGTRTKVAAALVKGDMGRMKKLVDPSEVGGTPFLGISKPVVKAHGSSDARAVTNAILRAVEYAESGFIADIENNISLMKVERNTEKN